MPRFLIERNIPGAGAMTEDELRAISRKSNEVLTGLGDAIAWRHSYVAGDKIYCVYDAPDPDLIREHARQGGFPADAVVEVAAVIDPATGH